MLEELHVANLGIIRSARIEPNRGLIAITGETGTGKTLLLGALRLLRGDNARTDRVGPFADEALVEGRFMIGSSESVVARRVAEGKSRAYLDGSMVPARTLSERFDALVEIVAQHEHVALGKEASIRKIVDGLLDEDGRRAVAGYQTAWDRLTGLRADRDDLGGDVDALRRDLEQARHQSEEIAAASLQPGEDDALKTSLSRLRNAGDIIEQIATSSASLDSEEGATDGLRTALVALDAAQRLDGGLGEHLTRLRGLIAEADELARDLREVAESIDHDPETLARAEERQAALGALKRKYGATLDEVIRAGQEADARVTRLGTLVERAATIDQDLQEAESVTESAGAHLADARRRAGKALADDAGAHLRSLGFSDPVLEVQVSSATPGPSGADRMRLLFASDSGLSAGPVSRVASGGELSRLVLSVRVAAGVADADVVAFDEIDAGVGGSTALAMGELLARLSGGRQVFVVTHLPQVAAFADQHFVVERAGKEATIRQVEADDRVTEMARMLAGMGDSDAGRDHANELLALAQRRRGG